MRHILLTGAAFVAALAVPAALNAQTDSAAPMAMPAPMMAMTPEQQAAMTGWPMDKQTMFKTWPADYQAYFWTLTPDQQTGYWALTNQQRGQIQQMTPEQRMAAWQAIQAQLAGQPVPMAQSAPMTETVAPATEAMNKTYPLCSKTVQDSCQNRGEGGAAGVSRASDTKGGPPAYTSRKKRR